MSTTQRTNIWDAIIAITPAIFVLFFCLGIGGCWYLAAKGDAEVAKAKASQIHTTP